jgi:hypothetical protein
MLKTSYRDLWSYYTERTWASLQNLGLVCKGFNRWKDWHANIRKTRDSKRKTAWLSHGSLIQRLRKPWTEPWSRLTSPRWTKAKGYAPFRSGPPVQDPTAQNLCVRGAAVNTPEAGAARRCFACAASGNVSHPSFRARLGAMRSGEACAHA